MVKKCIQIRQNKKGRIHSQDTDTPSSSKYKLENNPLPVTNSPNLNWVRELWSKTLCENLNTF
jgi:hypothetical protein